MFNTLEFRALRPMHPSLSGTTPNPTYTSNINFNNNKLLQKCAWQRYTNSQLFLGDKVAETLRVSVCHNQNNGV